MTISRRLRFEILRRDGYTCRYCGAKAPDVALTIDHVIATALGGGDDPTNLVTACQPCNAGKASIAVDAQLVADVDAAALLFARAIEQVAATRRRELGLIDEHLETFLRTWNDWTWEDRQGEHHVVPLPPNWRASIERFLSLGLSLDDLARHIRIAMEANVRDEWRYFCGVAWNEIGTRQELARRLIEEGEV